MTNYLIEFKKLESFLKIHRYPLEYVQRLRWCESLVELSVHNFLSIVAFLLNLDMGLLKGRLPLPKPYATPRYLRIKKLQRENIISGVIAWQKDLNVRPLTRKQVISELRHYAKLRADLLITLIKEHNLRQHLNMKPSTSTAAPVNAVKAIRRLRK